MKYKLHGRKDNMDKFISELQNKIGGGVIVSVTKQIETKLVKVDWPDGLRFMQAVTNNEFKNEKLVINLLVAGARYARNQQKEENT